MKDLRYAILLGLFFLVFTVCMLIGCMAMKAWGAPVTVTGYLQPDDNWRLSLGYNDTRVFGVESLTLKTDWFRQAKDGRIVSGYDVLTAKQVSFLKAQYKQSHVSDRDLDTQELSAMGSVWGIGIGGARSWIGEWDDGKWMAKAQYALDTKFVSIGVDWASNFLDRRSWSASPRLNIPRSRMFAFTLKGKWQESTNADVVKKWWSADTGVSVELDEVRADVAKLIELLGQ